MNWVNDLWCLIGKVFDLIFEVILWEILEMDLNVCTIALFKLKPDSSNIYF